MPSTDYDVIIIGAGHNGLTTAAYLAKAGLRVLSLERRKVLGGATLTDEIFPGYRLPRYSYAALLLEGKVVQDLDLESHSLKVLPVDPERIHPFPDGRAVRVWNDDAQVAEEIARISPPDANAYLKWVDFWERAARIIHPYMLTPPPTLAEVMASVQGTDDEAVLERILFGSAYDMLDQFFESEQVKALFAWSFNDAPLFFARLETSRFGDPRYHGILKGGMGSLPRSIEQAARSHGAQFETNAEVRRVLIENGSAIGVELADGRQIRAGTVVSNLDPKRSLLDIVDEGHLPSDFRARIRSLKNMRASMKLHASLSEPPDLSHYFGGDWDLGYLGRVRMCPSLDHVRAGRADADACRLPHHPSMIMQIPSVYDPSMAPEGKHCMSVWVETAAFELADGSWDDAREQVADIIVDALSVYAPNIKNAIIDRQVVTPLDLVREVGLTNGDILHLDMTPQQFFASRPLRGWNSYRTPIENYYLCGAGTHPGGYVSGAPGHNAAHAILRDMELAS